MHLSLAISGPWLKTSPLDLIETLYGRTVEDCALVVPWPMERPSRKKCTRVLRYGGPKSTGTPLASVLDSLLFTFFSGNVTGGVGMLRGLCAQEYPLALLRPTTTMVTLVGQPRAQGRRST